jgi:hypothetical protein
MPFQGMIAGHVEAMLACTDGSARSGCIAVISP